jgi:hypothetical protein
MSEPKGLKVTSSIQATVRVDASDTSKCGDGCMYEMWLPNSIHCGLYMESLSGNGTGKMSRCCECVRDLIVSEVSGD